MLSAIRGFATLIGEDMRPGDPIREDINQILLAADRGAQLTRRLLAVAGPRPEPATPEGALPEVSMPDAAASDAAMLGAATPGAVVRDAAVPEERSRERSTGRLVERPRRATILVVEDDDLMRTMAIRVLGRSGLGTLEAATADEAEALADTHAGQIDLLLADVALPARSGPALVAKLRERWPTLKVLYMTAFTKSALSEQGIWIDPGYLEKPFAPALLVERVEALLGESDS